MAGSAAGADRGLGSGPDWRSTSGSGSVSDSAAGAEIGSGSSSSEDSSSAPVAGLILAAGGGRRLGGVAKALLPYRGGFLVERAVRTARLGGCAEVVVVLGFDAESVRRRADLDGCLVAENPDWESGLGSSLRTGLAAVPDHCRATAVLLVDQPFVTAEAVRAVLAAHRRGAAVVTASYGGRRGHPVLFAAAHTPEVVASAIGDQGARAFLAAHEAETVTVACDGLGALDDIDTPADLAKLEISDAPESGSG